MIAGATSARQRSRIAFAAVSRMGDIRYSRMRREPGLDFGAAPIRPTEAATRHYAALLKIVSVLVALSLKASGKVFPGAGRPSRD